MISNLVKLLEEKTSFCVEFLGTRDDKAVQYLDDSKGDVIYITYENVGSNNFTYREVEIFGCKKSLYEIANLKIVAQSNSCCSEDLKQKVLYSLGSNKNISVESCLIESDVIFKDEFPEHSYSGIMKYARFSIRYEYLI